MLAQLRYMLAAGQSAQMAQEDEQGILSILPHTCQRDGLTIKAEEDYIGGYVIWLEVHKIHYAPT